ncbi:methionyl-tRNA formyltransferase [Arcanobacterium wilhelmae]|uniref:Methionyl-tRNA formyltransferase n=1 Tax=Arcanobacterium wilhelmae TaxID=1803177 RepID=A0ABT9N9E2_9ACTO|nr:methionyl-tRNA formyltransferase [Arcanobacterium wilhelmae]MDP9800026.1 methionyl-tRNA formyltransferase [Arcanobacterium wilhelmae]WFN89523.1 methionyl-tRNA formyltransferase [Arcanobacterium wilhelmae]
MRIIFAGTPETSVPALRLLAERHEVVAVLTRAPAPVGRKRVLTPSPVQVVAEELGVPVLSPSTLKDPQVQAQIAAYVPEAVAVVAYGLIIPQALLDVPVHGWINLHFSALPRWRGAAPVQYSIISGDPQIATATFRIEAGLDTGDVFSIETFPRDPSMTAGEALNMLAVSGAEHLARTLDELAAGTAVASPQEGEVTHAPQLTSANAHVNFARPATEVVNLILGTTPAPGAWATVGGTRVKLGPVLAIESTSLAPGEVALVGKKALAGTGTTDVELTQVAPAGKKHMPAADWLRGLSGRTQFEVKDV